MPPLGSIFRSGSSRPKVDQHSLFTSIQVSVPVLQGNLQIYEPWKKKRVRAKMCQVTLYSNDTSPFLVWSKIINSQTVKSTKSLSTSHSVTGTSNSDANVLGKPRCVLPVSRARITKTTGGCFEVVDFSTSAVFRFVTPTIYESEMWVEQLKIESQREANLDMGSICSTCSSSSSHSSPVSNEYNGFFSAMPTTPRVFSRSGYSLTSSDSGVTHSYDDDVRIERTKIIAESDDVFQHDKTVNYNGSFSRNQNSKLRHTRAQPHLGGDVHAVEKHRPELSNFLENANNGLSNGMQSSKALPFSEYFVNLPNS